MAALYFFSLPRPELCLGFSVISTKGRNLFLNNKLLEIPQSLFSFEMTLK